MIWELKGLTGTNNNVCKIRFAHKFRPELKGKNTEWEKIASFLPLENICRGHIVPFIFRGLGQITRLTWSLQNADKNNLFL